jgi:C4-dicarboxylate transporter DctM subunit
MISDVSVGLMGIFALLTVFVSGIEIGFAMAVVGAIGMCYFVSFPAAINMVGKDFFEIFSSYNLTVVPLFMFMGQIAFQSGIANKLYDGANKFIGHLPGGLAMATVAGATVFKAICGSSPATTATFASVAVPEMERRGYDQRLSTGIVATVGTLGFLIPPSSALILLGIITEQSIGQLFLAGMLPGLLLAAFFIATTYAWCKLNPAIGPRSEKFGWKARVMSLPEVIWPLVIFLVMVGGLMKGFFTPTEAGSLGTFAVLMLAFAKRRFSIKQFKDAVSESMRPTAMIMMLIVGSTIFGHFLTLTQIPAFTSDWIIGFHLPPWLVMAFIMFVYLVGGSVIDDLAFMFLATPIFFPAAIKLGYSPLWFGIMVGLTVGIGVVLPPVAICVFIVKNLTKVPFSIIYKGVYPYLAALVAVGILLFIFPQIATYLPSVLYKD